MTNTKFRKRALLSSVAMLLVALVAIGSATFAWFTTSPNASAAGLQIKATAGAGLELQSGTDTRGFTKATLLNYDTNSSPAASSTEQFNIQPASYVGGGTFLSVKAADSYSPDADPTDTIAPADVNENLSSARLDFSATSGVYKEAIKVKVTGGNAETVYFNGISTTAATTNPLVKSALRILLTKADGTVVAYTNASGATSGSETKAFDAADSGKLYSASTVGNTNTEDDVTARSFSNSKASIGTVDGTGDTTLYLYVFLDGFDANCKSSVVDGSKLISGITVNFTLTA